MEYSNTWNLRIVGALSRSEACTFGMRVDALCKPHAGIGCSLDTPKHLIHGSSTQLYIVGYWKSTFCNVCFLRLCIAGLQGYVCYRGLLKMNNCKCELVLLMVLRSQ